MVFDESEVRKIIVDCKRVLDYLAVSEVIETLEDLVQFVKDMSPCLTKVHMYTYSKHLGRGGGGGMAPSFDPKRAYKEREMNLLVHTSM